MTEGDRRRELEVLEDEREQLTEALALYRGRVFDDTGMRQKVQLMEDRLARCERDIGRLSPASVELST